LKIVTDVTGDKKILKKIKKAGEGFDHPNEGSQVKGNFYLNSQEHDLGYNGGILANYKQKNVN